MMGLCHSSPHEHIPPVVKSWLCVFRSIGLITPIEESSRYFCRKDEELGSCPSFALINS